MSSFGGRISLVRTLFWVAGVTAVLLIGGVSACKRSGEVAGSPAVDSKLAEQIAGIAAIDNHAHPMLSPPDFSTDRGFDALPVDNMEANTDPAGMRPEVPALHDAWKALFGFEGQPPLSAVSMKELDAARDRVRRQQGANYSTYVLDRAGIGTMLANRMAMGTGVQPPRFRWVPYVDALIFPLDNSGLAAATPDRRQFFPLEDKVRARYMEQVGLKALPATFEAYLKQVVTPVLEQQKAGR